MHVGKEEASQSKIPKCRICVQKRGVCIMYHAAQKTAESAVKIHSIKDYQLVLITFNMAHVGGQHSYQLLEWT
jgi:hypothetical protein